MINPEYIPGGISGLVLVRMSKEMLGEFQKKNPEEISKENFRKYHRKNSGVKRPRRIPERILGGMAGEVPGRNFER